LALAALERQAQEVMVAGVLLEITASFQPSLQLAAAEVAHLPALRQMKLD
jgi:hypothetical protein